MFVFFDILTQIHKRVKLIISSSLYVYKYKKMKRFGFAQIPVMLGLLIMAIAVPVATKLVQQNQENRGKAAMAEPCKICNSSKACVSSGYSSCVTSENECNSNADCAGTAATATKKPVASSTKAPCTPYCSSICSHGCDTLSCTGGHCKPAPTATTKPSYCNVELLNTSACGGGGCKATEVQQTWKTATCGTTTKCVTSTRCSTAVCSAGQYKCIGTVSTACLNGQWEGIKQDCKTYPGCDSTTGLCKPDQTCSPEGKTKCVVEGNNNYVYRCSKSSYYDGLRWQKDSFCGKGCTNGACIVPTEVPLKNNCNAGDTCVSGLAGSCSGGNTYGSGLCEYIKLLGVGQNGICCTKNKLTPTPTIETCSPEGKTKCVVEGNNNYVYRCSKSSYYQGLRWQKDSFCGNGCVNGSCIIPTEVPLRNNCNAGDTCVSGMAGSCSGGTTYGSGRCEYIKLLGVGQNGVCCTKNNVPTVAPGAKCSSLGGKCYSANVSSQYNCKEWAVGDYSDCYFTVGSAYSASGYYDCCKTLTPKVTVPTLTPIPTYSCTGSYKCVDKPMTCSPLTTYGKTCPPNKKCVSSSAVCTNPITVTLTPTTPAQGFCAKFETLVDCTKNVQCKWDYQTDTCVVKTTDVSGCYCPKSDCSGICKYSSTSTVGYKCADSKCTIPSLTPTTPPTTCACVGGKWTGNGCGSNVVGKPCTIVTPPATCDPTKYKGEKSGNIWLHFDDIYTAKCICGGTDYHYVCASGFWACGDGRKDTNCPKCVEACPNSTEKNLLQSCTPPDSDGTSLDTLCNKAGITGSCGGKTYCCPSVGGAWTSDMTKCSGVCGIIQGKVWTLNDFSIWRSEYIEGSFGTISKTTWKADYDCDGKVTLNDFSIWRTNFIKSL